MVRFDDRFIDELKTRLRPSDVIGRTVQLRRQGREFVGLSPFNKEKTPSFFVNDEKGQFFDFSSGKSGDVIAFLQENEKLSFVEAVEKLAAEAGMSLPAPDARAAETERKFKGLADWLELAASWFEAELRRPGGAEARSYLLARGLPESEWRRFRIGYAPSERTALRDYLVVKGALASDLVDCGVAIAPEDGGAPYDRFRNRIIFPITSVRDRVISFGGRALDPTARAKYLNGSETALFDKGQTLYGLASAREIIRKADAPTQLVVVEGYFDVIACSRSGIPAVSPMGTALTEGQLEALWRVHSEPTLCFDGDTAGRRAVGRAIERALPLLTSKRSLNFAFVRGGKDPDDILREQGQDALRSQLGQTTPFVDELFQLERERTPTETPEQKADLKGRLRRLSSLIREKDLADQYRQDLLDRFYEGMRRSRFSREGAAFDFVDKLKRLLNPGIRQLLEERIRTLNAAVAVTLCQHPTWLHNYLERFAQWGFGDKRLSPLVQPLIDTLDEPNPTEATVMSFLRGDGAQETFEKAKHFAEEVDVYPFLNVENPTASQRAAWEACFNALIELSAIEIELAERRADFTTGKPVIDVAGLVNRGPWLREHRSELLVSINSGALWQANLETKLPG